MELETAKIFIAKLVRQRDELSLCTLVSEIAERVEREMSGELDVDGVSAAAEQLVDELDRVFNPGRTGEVIVWGEAQ